MDQDLAIAIAFGGGIVFGGLIVYLIFQVFVLSKLSSKSENHSGISPDKLLELFIQNQNNFNAGKLSAEQFEEEQKKLLKKKGIPPKKVITASFQDLDSNIDSSSLKKETGSSRSTSSDLNALRKIQKKEFG